MSSQAHSSLVSDYQLSMYFELAIEYINAVAGILVLFAVLISALNLAVLGLNSLLGMLHVYILFAGLII